jgi:hypothetical protein
MPAFHLLGIAILLKVILRMLTVAGTALYVSDIQNAAKGT